MDGFTGELEFAIVFAQDGFTPVFYVTFENNLVADVFFYLNDHLSTPRALVDNTGTVVWRSRYAPFGSTGTNPFPDFEAGDIGIDTDPDNDGTDIIQLLRFPGQWDDGIEGIWYNHHRFYLPEYGMYGRRDPIPRVDGNAFSYAGGNPVMSVDPLGLDSMGGILGGQYSSPSSAQSMGNAFAAFGGWLGDLLHGPIDIPVPTHQAGGGWQGTVEWAEWNAKFTVSWLAAEALAGAWAAGKLGDGGVCRPATKGPKPKVKKHGPDPAAEGSHTVYKSGANGNVNGYTEFDAAGNAVKRFRGTGKPHGGKSPPFILEKKLGKGPGAPLKVPREPLPWELPYGYK